MTASSRFPNIGHALSSDLYPLYEIYQTEIMNDLTNKNIPKLVNPLVELYCYIVPHTENLYPESSSNQIFLSGTKVYLLMEEKQIQLRFKEKHMVYPKNV